MDMSGAAPEEGLRLYYDVMEFNPESPSEPDFEAPAEARPFAERLVEGVFQSLAEIDARIVTASENWRMERMSVVDRNILRIALYEMLHCADIPPKVSINEAVDLGKTYGSEESGGFINGILDHLYTQLGEEKKAGDS